MDIKERIMQRHTSGHNDRDTSVMLHSSSGSRWDMAFFRQTKHVRMVVMLASSHAWSKGSMGDVGMGTVRSR